jgi:hypothetical protein
LSFAMCTSLIRISSCIWSITSFFLTSVKCTLSWISSISCLCLSPSSYTLLLSWCSTYYNSNFAARTSASFDSSFYMNSWTTFFSLNSWSLWTHSSWLSMRDLNSKAESSFEDLSSNCSYSSSTRLSTVFRLSSSISLTSHSFLYLSSNDLICCSYCSDLLA